MHGIRKQNGIIFKKEKGKVYIQSLIYTNIRNNNETKYHNQ